MTSRKRSPVEVKVTEAHLCSSGVRLDALSRAPFFSHLPRTDLQQINSLFHEKGYQAEQIICAQGDPGERLFVVADGRVKLLRHSLAGKDVLLDILTSGEFFGSLSTSEKDHYPDTAQAQTQTCVLTIDRPAFRQILDRYPSVAMKVLDIMTSRLRATETRLQQLSVLPVEGRLANTLLLLGDKFGEPGELGLLIQAPLSRDDLAALTGTTTETASRVLSQFQKDGLIQSGREWVALTDRERLAVIAGRDMF